MRDDPGSSLPVILMGFSRGGLVLNQILIEMGTAVYSDSIMQRVPGDPLAGLWERCSWDVLSQH